MRLVIQRVISAEVWINEHCYSTIGKGILVLLGIANNDDQNDINYLVDKMINLRIFPDEENIMNLSLLDISAELMIVSQFTLYGDISKGRRPSYSIAMEPAKAKILYNKFIERVSKYNITPATGKFAAMMNIKLINWGPVTLLLNSKAK